MNKNKIQSLVISHLQQHGKLEILLPDGVVLEIGTLQENQNGELIKTDDYCFVIATREGRSACIDSFNLGLSFSDDETTKVFEDTFVNADGISVRKLEVI